MEPVPVKNPRSFVEQALDAYEASENARLDRERQEWDEQEREARSRIAARFAEHMKRPGLTVTRLEQGTPGADAGWFKFIGSAWDAPYTVLVEGVRFIAFTGSGSLFVVLQCGICKAYWTEGCDYELVSIGAALATLHDCEKPGKTSPAEEGSPSSKLRDGAMGAVLGGPDSDNLAVIAHNLGVIAAELERFVDCGASMAGRGT